MTATVDQRAQRVTSPIDRQPALGIAGLLIVAGVFAILGMVWAPQVSLLIIGPISVFWLPVLVASAIWWGAWPADKLERPMSGVVNTAIFAVSAVILTLLGEAVIGKVDVAGLFSAFAGPPSIEAGRFTTFPWTLPLSAAIFVTTLQITFVSGKWPLQKLSPVASGFAALALSWIIGTVVYYLFADWDPVLPAEARAAIGLRNGGLLVGVNALDFVSLLVTVAVWQVVFFIGLQGWPFTTIQAARARLLASNVGVVFGSVATYVLLANGLAWDGPTIAAVGGCVIAGVLIAAMLFETWPFQAAAPSTKRLGLAIVVAAVAFVLFVGLRAIGTTFGTWDIAPVELWVGVSGLNYIAAVVILHYAVWGRWPLRPPAPPAR